ncbi:MAG: GLUG motif-containing protein, partial [archaeon]
MVFLGLTLIAGIGVAQTEIQDWYDLNDVRNDKNGNYILMNDLDSTTAGYDELVNTSDGWDPIGKYERDSSGQIVNDDPFTGFFDGNGYIIDDLYIGRGGNRLGLFGYIESADITNLGITNINISEGNWHVGGLAGRNYYSDISNSYVTGFINGSEEVGGLIGNNWRGNGSDSGGVYDSYAYINVTGDNRVGGLIGRNGAFVNNSHAIGNVNGKNEIGGLIGYGQGSYDVLYSTVSNTYFKGTVNGSGGVGGLIGSNRDFIKDSHSNATVEGVSKVGGLTGDSTISHVSDTGYSYYISNSYATGNVTGKEKVGGLSGENQVNVSKSYFEGNVEGDNEVGGLFGEHFYKYDVSDTYYNIPSVLINGKNRVTFGALYEDQYNDWFNSGKELDISNYESTLIPANENTYNITNITGLKHLLGFANNESYSFQLTDNIELAENEYELHIPYLAADFNGNNYTVDNLHINQSFNNNIGMFGYTDGSVVENMKVVDVDISGNRNTGGLIGSNYDSLAIESYSNGSITGDNGVGGLIGFINEGSFILGSYSTANVTGRKIVGGLIGESLEGLVENSRFNGRVISKGERLISKVGGLVGSENPGFYGETIKNSQSEGIITLNVTNLNETGDVGGLVGQGINIVESKSNATIDVIGGLKQEVRVTVGGLAGHLIKPFVPTAMGESSTLNNSYSEGKITEDLESIEDRGMLFAGGLVGYNNNDLIIDSYSTTSITKNTQNKSIIIGSLVGSEDSDSQTVDSIALESNFSLIGINQGEQTGRVTEAPEEDMKSIALYTYDDFKDYDALNKVWDITINSVSSEDGDSYPYHGNSWMIDQKSFSYEIEDWCNLHSIRYDLEGNYTLMNNLNESSDCYYEYNNKTTEGWDPIEEFKGQFNGQGHKIDELYMDRQNISSAGLFSIISNEGEVKDLEITNINISVDREQGGDCGLSIGGLAGRNAGNIYNTNLTGTIASNNSYGTEPAVTGGLLGQNGNRTCDEFGEGGNITNSHTHVNITAVVPIAENIHAGGLIGWNGPGGGDAGYIKNSSASGDVTADSNRSTHAGGLIGRVGSSYEENDGAVINSHATGNIYATGPNHARAGGLIGQNSGWNSINGTVQNSYATGSVTIEGGDSGNRAGGLIGLTFSPVHRSHATGNINAGISEGINKNPYGRGSLFAGGLIGQITGSPQDVEISESYSTGSVTANDPDGSLAGCGLGTGGLIGRKTIFDESISVTISDSYTTSNVSALGNNSAINISGGGLMGLDGGDNNYIEHGTTILNSYAANEVQSDNHTGSIIGTTWITDEAGDPTNITNSYADKNLTNEDLIGHVYNESQVEPVTENSGLKTTEQMRNISTFNETWSIGSYTEEDLNDGYPFL